MTKEEKDNLVYPCQVVHSAGEVIYVESRGRKGIILKK